MPFRHVLLTCVTLGVLATAVSGCKHAQAKTVTDSPPLNTPAAPPRVIETVEATAPAPVPLIEEPARQPIRPPARPQRAESTPPRPAEPPKVEAPAPETPIVEAPAPAAKPPATLQTTPAGAEAEVERAIRTLLAKANTDLSHVDYRTLNQGARSQYDSAKRFIQQAEEALKPPRKLDFAKNLADKASALAAQLAGR